MVTKITRSAVLSLSLGLLLFAAAGMVLCPSPARCQDEGKSQEEKEAKVHADFNKAVALYNQGKLDQARDLFLQVKNSGVYLGFFKNRDLYNYLARIEEQVRKAPTDRVEEINAKYEHGKALYDEGRYVEAKKVFEEVRDSKVNLGFFKDRALKSYLARIDDDIQKQRREPAAAPKPGEQPPVAEKPTTPRAEPTPPAGKKVEEAAPVPTVDEVARVRKEQMISLYEEGKRFYDQDRWSEARDALQKVADSGVDIGWWRNRSLQSMLLNAKRRAEQKAVESVRAPEPTPGRKNELMQKFQEAEALLAAGRYDESALLYQEIKSAKVDLGDDVNRKVNANLETALAESRKQRAAAMGGDAEARALLDKVRMEKKIIDQKNRTLADHYASVGEKFYNEQSYAKAKEQFEKALRLVSDHPKAAELLQKSEAYLGVEKERFKTQADRLAEEKTVQIQQKKFEMENKLREGVTLLKDDKYDEALAAFEVAAIIINRLRRDIDVTSYEDHLNSLVELATRRREERQIEIEKTRKKEATKKAKEDETRQKEMSEQKIQTMYEQAYSAFLKERYDDVIKTCRDILDEDPSNAAVEALKERAKIEQEKKTWRDVKKMDMDEHEKNRQYLKDATLPRLDLEGFPKKDVWERIKQREDVQYPQLTSDLTEKEKLLESALKEKRVDISFESTPIADVVSFLRTLVEMNVALDKAVPEDTTITLELKDVSLESALKNICMLGENLTYTIKNDAIWITTKEATAGDMIILVYDVRDLLLAVIDRPRKPNILGENPTMAGGGGLDFGGGGGAGTGGLARDSKGRDLMDIELQVRGKELVKLLVQVTGPESWAAAPAYIVPHLATGGDDDLSEGIEGGEGQGTIAFRDGDLIIKQRKEIHDKIRTILTRMRESLYLQVQIDCRFLTVSDNFLEEIGTDISDLAYRSDGRGLLNPTAAMQGYPYGFTSPTNQVIGNPGTQNINASPTTRWANRWQRGWKWDPTLNAPVASGSLFGMSNPFDVTGNAVAPFSSTSDASLGSLLGTSFQNIGMNLGLSFLSDLQATFLIKAAQNSNTGEILASPRLTVFNTQRANVSVGQSYAYIQDADVGNQGALDPEVGTVTSRTSLDVRPIVSADRRFVYLELCPEVLQLTPGQGSGTQPFRRIPITAIAQIGNTPQPVTMSIELPQQQFQIVETTVCIPDRGHLLVGGIANVTHQEVESGVPILNKIPIIKRLFSRHSTINQRANLLILIHPTILAQDELEDNVY